MQIQRQVLSYDFRRATIVEAEILIIGSGIAGLTAALAAAERGRVLLVCKGKLHNSNTWHAQGGIAAPTPDSDDVESHVADTIRVGCGLADPGIVKCVIERAQPAIDKLIAHGVSFDRTGGDLARTREGGHSRSRVLHARGDATGLELSSTLAGHVRQSERIRVMESCLVADLTLADGVCVGAIAQIGGDGILAIFARSTILATGGAGKLYRYTTNPAGATADGAAIALRAGAVLTDMEFVQFHPTALHVGAEPLPLISEALRGEGARLVDAAGRRFMNEYHPEGELAPRDVVSRAIFEELRRSGGESVFLDARHWPAGFMAARFPSVHGSCLKYGIDPAVQPIPVRPAAHYMIGGVRVDLKGRSSLPGLLACGEAACTGMHGANRLASNSLLEALVLGEVCGRAAIEAMSGTMNVGRPESMIAETIGPRKNPRNSSDLLDLVSRVRDAAWVHIGIVRHGAGIREMSGAAEQTLAAANNVLPSSAGIELLNLATAAAAIALAAARRTESRGVHYRSDYPKCDEAIRRRIELFVAGGELTARFESDSSAPTPS